MTEFTPARLAELRGVAEAAEPMMVFGGPAQNTYVSVEKQELLALIAALEAKTAEVESRIEDRDWFKARAEGAEAALERVKGTFFKNRLYLMMMSYPAFNNPAGEALHDKIDKLIQQTIEGTHE